MLPWFIVRIVGRIAAANAKFCIGENNRASGNRATAGIRSCEGGKASTLEDIPGTGFSPSQNRNKKGKSYEKASLDWIGDKRTSFCSGAAF
jgi:hypothetical protein